MKQLKATEISYIIEAQIRGVSVNEVLNKRPQDLSVNTTEKNVEVVAPVKVAPKKRAKKIKE